MIRIRESAGDLAILAVRETIDRRQGSGGDDLHAEFNIEWAILSWSREISHYQRSGKRDPEIRVTHLAGTLPAHQLRRDLAKGAVRTNVYG